MVQLKRKRASPALMSIKPATFLSAFQAPEPPREWQNRPVEMRSNPQRDRHRPIRLLALVVVANHHLLWPLRRPLVQLFLRLLQAAPIECAAAVIATPIVGRLLEEEEARQGSNQ